MGAIDTLLRLAASSPEEVLSRLEQSPDKLSLARATDSAGYSLMHAAASYSHLDLLRQLVKTYGLSPDMADEDGETPLFAAETIPVAKCLLIELGASLGWKNKEGLTAIQSLSAEEESTELVQWLENFQASLGGAPVQKASSVSSSSSSSSSSCTSSSFLSSATSSSSSPSVKSIPNIATPDLPKNIQVKFSLDGDSEPDQQPDPVFRQRIEELVARGDFQSPSSQAILRQLVTDAIDDLHDQPDRDSSSRKRIK